MTPALRFTLIPLAVLCMAGCSRFHSPTVDVLGSYFPAWMVCMIGGLIVTLVVRLLFAALKLDSFLRPGAVIYPCLLAIFTMAAWLLFFQN